MNRCAIFFVVFFAGLSLGVQAQSPDAVRQDSRSSAGTEEGLQIGVEVAQKLQRYLDKTTSLTAQFESVLLDAKRQATATSEGLVYIKRPGKFRWEYRTPSPSIVLADGTWLWSYDEELEQAIKRNMSDYRGANPTMLLGGGSNLTDSFRVKGSYATADSDNEQIEWLELEPIDETSDFVKVRLGFKGDIIQLMELFDRLEQTTRIQFTGVQTNVAIDDALFVFEPPENVDVVGDND